METTFLIIGAFGSIFVWLTLIRPYAVKQGQGFTPGANVGISAWIDWQQSKEIAEKRGDRWMLWICRLFLALNLLVVAGFFLIVMP
jgi:hypothetical protein